jgi:hypothetical protein
MTDPSFHKHDKKLGKWYCKRPIGELLLHQKHLQAHDACNRHCQVSD